MIDKLKLKNVSDEWIIKFNNELEMLLLDIRDENGLDTEELSKLLDIDEELLNKFQYRNAYSCENQSIFDLNTVIRILIAAKKVIGIEDMETSCITYDVDTDEVSNTDLLCQFIEKKYQELEDFGRENNIPIDTNTLLDVLYKFSEKYECPLQSILECESPQKDVVNDAIKCESPQNNSFYLNLNDEAYIERLLKNLFNK